MKKEDKIDRELQKMIFEGGKSPIDLEDADLYKMIHEVVEEEPKFSLGDDFALNVTKQAVKRKALQKTWQSILFKSVLVAVILLMGGAAFYFISKDTFNQLTSLLITFKYQVLFVLVMLVGIQFLDQFLIQKNKKPKTSGWI